MKSVYAFLQWEGALLALVWQQSSLRKGYFEILCISSDSSVRTGLVRADLDCPQDVLFCNQKSALCGRRLEAERARSIFFKLTFRFRFLSVP